MMKFNHQVLSMQINRRLLLEYIKNLQYKEIDDFDRFNRHQKLFD